MIRTSYQKIMDLDRFCKVYLDVVSDLDFMQTDPDYVHLRDTVRARTEVEYLWTGIPAIVNERTNCLI